MRRIARFVLSLSLCIALTSFAAEIPKGPPQLPSGALEEATIEPIPGGTTPMIKRAYRPPNYESPTRYFNQAFTPNDRFFVRYHLANIPTVALKDWKLRIGGDAAGHPIVLTLEDLKSQFKQVEVPALAFCSGNHRGLADPHVPGVQWGYGAMGNARWKGVRLKDVLAKAGVGKDAVEVAFDGADGPVLDKTPDFQKSLPMGKALDENTLIAFEMNGKPLSKLQGFPARLVVPGWTATYWVKHLVSIQLLAKPFEGYWVKSAYRIPKGKFPSVQGKWPGQETDTTLPITQLIVSSLITNVEEGQHFRKGASFVVKGVAWDGGHGIEKVEVSLDGGNDWVTAKLGHEYGKYSWRQFSYPARFKEAGTFQILAKATNRAGDTQVEKAIPNPGGYHNNEIQRIPVHVE